MTEESTDGLLNGETIDSLLDKDDIVKMFDGIMEKSDNPRCGLLLVINDGGGYSLDAVGRVSHLEWLGLAILLKDYCNERAELCFEEGGETFASTDEEIPE